MKTGLLLVSAMLIAIACTDEHPRTSPPRRTDPAETTPAAPTREAEIYAAVIRQLVTKDHTFGGGESPFERIYIVNGPVESAGNPRSGAFLTATQVPFSPETTTGIKPLLDDLPPLEFIRDARRAFRSSGEVRRDGVIITLGPIDERTGRIRVPNGLWCGGKCGQWLTYVLRDKNGRWIITGTTGPIAIS